ARWAWNRRRRRRTRRAREGLPAPPPATAISTRTWDSSVWLHPASRQKPGPGAEEGGGTRPAGAPRRTRPSGPRGLPWVLAAGPKVLRVNFRQRAGYILVNDEPRRRADPAAPHRPARPRGL